MKSEHCIWICCHVIQKIGVRFSHLVLWGHFLLPFCLMGLSMCCLPPYHDIIIFLLYIQFILLTPLVVLVTYQSVCFLGICTICPFCHWIWLILWLFLCIMNKLVQGFFYMSRQGYVYILFLSSHFIVIPHYMFPSQSVVIFS